jgi:hypothetical protein
VRISGAAFGGRNINLTSLLLKLLTHNLIRVIKYLMPLGMAANLVQGSVCWLDTALITLGYLFLCYQVMDNSFDEPGQTAVMNSFEL